MTEKERKITTTCLLLFLRPISKFLLPAHLTLLPFLGYLENFVFVLYSHFPTATAFLIFLLLLPFSTWLVIAMKKLRHNNNIPKVKTFFTNFFLTYVPD